MQKNTYRRFILCLICFMLVTLISACQLLHRTPPEEAVRLRIEKFMNAKINKDWATAYTYFDSVYHEMVTKNQFERKISKMSFKGFTIESIKMDPSGDKATAIVKVDLNVQGFDFKGNPETQIWVKEQWKWYLHVPPKDPKELLN
ncbi:MAG: hypothetical protein HF978_05110 [Desulfobacteraceae bacterium]|nr:hypothetical protein [Desulfobacteraceae bacterium]MBC2754910.1 hypothetical protein [Desulfobacteraceae bacterium]